MFVLSMMLRGETMSELDTNRLLMQFEKAMREINREAINPQIAELKLADLNPVLKMVAHARASYLKSLFDLSNSHEGVLPSLEQIKKLQYKRQTYEELVAGAKALEIAIERGYLDVEG